MFLKLLLISSSLVFLAIFGMMVKIIFKKGGLFPKSGVGHSKAMKQRGIYCAKVQQKLIDKKTLENKGLCSGCSCSHGTDW